MVGNHLLWCGCISGGDLLTGWVFAQRMDLCGQGEGVFGQGVSAQGGVSMYTLEDNPAPTYVLTHGCENITFP